jgi:glycosyltransferase involved in cell wall biosynthesis
MRILFVQCFATAGGLAPREAEFARRLASHGHEVKAFTLTKRGTKRHLIGDVEVVNFKVNDPDAPKSEHTSSALVYEARQFDPDLVIFKNIGFRVLDDVCDAMPRPTIFGNIIGGGLKSKQINRMHFFLVEHPGQIDFLRKRDRFSSALLEVMPKFILWEKVGNRPPELRKYDVCVAGSFNPRKNQMALAPLFDDVSIIFVGDGPELSAVQERAGGRPNLRFLGRIPHEEVFDVMSNSRLLVHPSSWEGVPRVSAEAFACGTPMVALRRTLGNAYGGSEFVVLIDDVSTLKQVTLDLLRDPQRLHAMSQMAREFAEHTHGAGRLEEIVEKVNWILSNKADVIKGGDIATPQ